jgi:hypothetical protein
MRFTFVPQVLRVHLSESPQLNMRLARVHILPNKSSWWRWAAVLLAMWLGACASPDQLLRVRSLGETYDAATDRHSNGSFHGLERLANFAQHENLNLLFVHGIGWTQRDGPQGFGLDWVDALASAYGVALPRPDPGALCQTSGQGETLPGQARPASGGLRLVQAEASAHATDDPLHVVRSQELGCLDRIHLPLGEGRSITVYRFFWDDTMWDTYQARHLGHDDPVPIANGVKKPTPGQEDIDALRTPVNAYLKNQLVTYGLSDAAMYLGPVGASMREGVRGALCAAALGLPLSHVAVSEAGALCHEPVTRQQPLAVMAHSLGSRIVFDALYTDLHPDLAALLPAAVSNREIEVYMLANQLPLIGLGRMGQPRSTARLHPTRLKLVAVSELDDPLTYELVPYFEGLYAQRCAPLSWVAAPPSSGTLAEPCADGGGQNYRQRAAALAKNLDVREQLVRSLGFDVVDIRVRFAPPVVTGLGWLAKDPHRAHSDYMNSPQVQQAVMCGANNGYVRRVPEGCPSRSPGRSLR